MRKLLSLIVLLCLTAGLTFGHPVDDLLSQIPPESAMCIIIRDLNAVSTQISKSPFAENFLKTKIGQKILLDQGIDKLNDLEDFSKQSYGMTTQELLRDIFGDAIIFSYQPGPPEKSLILIKPAKPDAAALFLSKIDETEKKEIVEIKSEKINDTVITIRIKKNSTEAYYIKDGILAFAGEVETLREHIHWQNLADKKISPCADSLKRLNCADQPFVLWMAPRAFDGEFIRKAEAEKNVQDKFFSQLFATTWQSIDDFAIHAEVKENLFIHASFRMNDSKSPKIAKNITAKKQQTALWSLIPNDAIFAVAGQVRLNEKLKIFDEEAIKAGAKPTNIAKNLGPIVGKDKIETVLEAIGPDWGLWVTTPEVKSDQHWLPDWTFTFRVQNDPSKKIDTGKSVVDSFDAMAQLARMAYNSANQDQIELGSDNIAGTQIRVVTGEKMPANFKPCYAIKQGFFIFASAPERIARFEAPKEEVNTNTPTPLIRLSGKVFREYLLAHQAKIVENIKKIRPNDDTSTMVVNLIDLLELVDKAEIAASLNDGTNRMTLTLTPSASLQSKP